MEDEMMLATNVNRLRYIMFLKRVLNILFFLHKIMS